MDKEAVRDWVLEQAKRFNSTRQMSLAAGLSQNTVSNILDRGKASPESLGAIADLVGVSRVQPFMVAGWLRQEDLGPQATLSVQEMEWLEALRRLDPAERQSLLSLAQRLSGTRPRST